MWFGINDKKIIFSRDPKRSTKGKLKTKGESKTLHESIEEGYIN